MRISGRRPETMRPSAGRQRPRRRAGRFFLLALGALGLQVSAGPPSRRRRKSSRTRPAPRRPAMRPSCAEKPPAPAAGTDAPPAITRKGTSTNSPSPPKAPSFAPRATDRWRKRKSSTSRWARVARPAITLTAATPRPFSSPLPPQLCTKCHEAIAAQFAKAKSSHSAALQGKACLTCHNPHTSDFAKLLAAKPMDVCLGCHSQAIKKDGQVIPNVKDEIAKAKVVHGPIQDGDCGACHDAHASGQFALLLAAYPATFYAPFTPEAYALCFQCHDQALVDGCRDEGRHEFPKRDAEPPHRSRQGRGERANLPRLPRASRRQPAAPDPRFGPVRAQRLALADRLPGDQDGRKLRPRLPRSEGLRPRESGDGAAWRTSENHQRRSAARRAPRAFRRT